MKLLSKNPRPPHGHQVANLAPTNVLLSALLVVDNAASGSVIGTISVIDPDDTAWSFSINNSKFQLSTAGPAATSQLQRSTTGTLVAGVAESVTITALDPHGHSKSVAFSISVSAHASPNLAPTALALSPSTVLDNVANLALVSTGTVTDADDTTLNSVTVSNDKFSIGTLSGLTFPLLRRTAGGALAVGVDETMTFDITDGHGNLFTSPTKTITIADSAVSSTLTLELTFPGGSPTGTTLIYDVANGTNQGDFTPPTASFIQHCIRVRHASLANFFVDFRPDADGTRTEVVVWNGECMGTVASDTKRDLPAYDIVIKNSGATIHSESIPHHYWGQRWRWQSAARPVIRTASQVFSEGWLPAMSKAAARITGYSGLIVPATPPAVGTYTTFMALDGVGNNTKLGLTCDVDRGGERPEIGLVTEWQADWLLNGTASSLAAMRQHAEMCAGDWNLFVPDQVTGAPINYKQDLAHYKANTYQNSSSPYGGYYRIGQGTRNAWDIHEADTHIPSLFYVPYALTEDPYLIEAAQYVVQYGVGWDIFQRETVYCDLVDGVGAFGTFTLCSYTNEIRALGWGIRNLAIAYKLAPASPPSWLLPQSYYASVSQDYAAVIHGLFTVNTDNRYAIFHQLGSDSSWQLFEQSYAVMGMGLADLVAMPASPSWASTLDFYFGFHAGITSGTSGWDRQCPQPHDLASIDLNALPDWASAFAHFKTTIQTNATYPLAASPGNRQGGSMGNCAQVTAACAVAKSRGIAAATDAKAWMDTFIDYNYPNNQVGHNADNSMGIAFYAKCGFTGA